MKINSVTIHNFRTIKHSTFNFDDYSVLIGANNQGKSNVIRALRVFYEKDKLKFDSSTDFPKYKTDDKDSWVEIEYFLTDNEYENLKDEYKLPMNHLKVRKYLFSTDAQKVKRNQSNIFGYTKDGLSDTLFYGAKNIAEAKLGSVIYIPDVMRTEDAFKLTGPSPFREILTFVMGKVVKKSQAYSILQNSFKTFHDDFSSESSPDGYSIDSFTENINRNLDDWGVKFNLTIDPIDSDAIIKGLINHSLSDSDLNEKVDVGEFGQGLQRHLIYTLLKVSADYVDKKEIVKKEFNPDFMLLLFEEPEAFLHPTQQEIMNSKLRIFAETLGQQILITTHSPNFVSKNIDHLSSLIRVRKKRGITHIYQISRGDVDLLISQNDQLFKFLEENRDSPSTPEVDKQALTELLTTDPEVVRLEQESIRYLLWMDSERCCSFFADRVLICEGPTEKIFIDYLIKTEWFEEFSKKKVYVIECGGKFQIHRFMNLFKKLGIEHSVLHDSDQNGTSKRAIQQKYVNDFLNSSMNEYSIKIDSFPGDLETFLGVSIPARADRKPLNLMWKYKSGDINDNRIAELKMKVLGLL